jgi:RHS repeat-associated protein
LARLPHTYKERVTGGHQQTEASRACEQALSYLATDGLGSVSASLDTSGNLTSAQLFAPYGATRYNSGTSPTAKGFTRQYGDAATGLAYYHARYYDPALGQFASADTVADGLNRYGYVRGNPTTATDPGAFRRHTVECGQYDGGTTGESTTR